jgi:hypothetical protein
MPLAPIIQALTAVEPNATRDRCFAMGMKTDLDPIEVNVETE